MARRNHVDRHARRQGAGAVGGLHCDMEAARGSMNVVGGTAAAGNAVVVHGMNGSADVTLMGLDPTFRAHPELTFRLLVNAIYNGLP
jgi:hypothetical protein